MRCAIHSASAGSVMVIPRENRLVRLYIQLTTTDNVAGGAKADRSKISPEVILEAAQRLLTFSTKSLIRKVTDHDRYHGPVQHLVSKARLVDRLSDWATGRDQLFEARKNISCW